MRFRKRGTLRSCPLMTWNSPLGPDSRTDISASLGAWAEGLADANTRKVSIHRSVNIDDLSMAALAWPFMSPCHRMQES